MNFDDYVNHIRKKYRLALAVTIIQNKPDHITTQEYIETLRKNIENETNTTLDEISINSNDFLYEDDAGKGEDNNLKRNEETTNNCQQHNKDLKNILFQENFAEDAFENNTTTELNKVEANEIGREINRYFDINNEKSRKLVTLEDEDISTSAFQTNAFNETVETHDNMNSPNILENFDLNHACCNNTLVSKEANQRCKDNNIMETLLNMNSPNILENFDIEHAIQAHTVSKTIPKIGKKDTIDRNGAVTNNVDSVVGCDVFASELQKQSHKNDEALSKATHISSIITKTNKQTSKPNILIEDTQQIYSDNDSNVTDCDIVNNSIDNLTDKVHYNNFNFNTQTTYCDETTQLETIDLININECINLKKDGYGQNKATKKAIDYKNTFCDLTEANTANLKFESHPKSKDKREFKIINKDLTVTTKSIKKSKGQNKFKRKLHQPNKNVQSQKNKFHKVDDSQATELYTVELSQHLSHISQSQVLNTYNIDPKHISRAKPQEILSKEIYENEIDMQLSPDIAYQDATRNFDNNNLNIDNKNRNLENSFKDCDPVNKYEETLYNSYKEINMELKNETIKANNNAKEEIILINKCKNVISNTDVTENNSDNNNYVINIVNDLNADETYTSNIKEHTATEREEENLEITNKDAEVIPFKVIEEMNRVKMYLNRNNNGKITVDGFSADSGFLSDSQIKSSLQLSSQSSQNWLNQSAHSLLDYLLKCPLLTTNMEFTEEIAVVLCDLIDKLHVDENYPPFLDLILEKIELFLEEITNGYNDQLESKTEQSIHRILLLNKSINIVKYTLEKLANTLEKTLENLTKSDTCYELTNVNETLNITYIFHILEILIKRYFNQKEGSSQNTQPSENLTKKTCITDIWRAKWNLKINKSVKELPLNQFANEDIIERLAIILNKIIINCMEGYSLVSFAALQCFNILQS